MRKSSFSLLILSTVGELRGTIPSRFNSPFIFVKFLPTSHKENSGRVCKVLGGGGGVRLVLCYFVVFSIPFFYSCRYVLHCFLLHTHSFPFFPLLPFSQICTHTFCAGGVYTMYACTCDAARANCPNLARSISTVVPGSPSFLFWRFRPRLVTRFVISKCTGGGMKVGEAAASPSAGSGITSTSSVAIGAGYVVVSLRMFSRVSGTHI